jgi:predicted HAD superfamily Cof-like phosphohydrolase
VKDLKELADLVYVIYGYALAAGYNLDEAVERVHDNNLGRCVQPDGTVKRREDGKIIKNPDYPAVYLKDLI